MALAFWTSAQIIAQLDSQIHWNTATITYSTSSSSGLVSYLGSSDPYENSVELTTYAPLNANQANAATLAITLWDDLMPQSFVAVNEAGGTNANIDLAGFQDSTSGGSYAYTVPNYSGNSLTKASVWVNDSYVSGTGSLLNPIIDNYGFQTFVHELGHALGLDHMGNYNGNFGSVPSSFQDSLVYSIMSYFGPNSALGGVDLGVAWANWGNWLPQTPMLDDVLAIQSMYGVSQTTRTGDTVYGFGSNISGNEASIYNFSLNAHPIMCLFDSSGNDTLNLSGDANSDLIDLHAGAFSSAMGLTNNISIAYSCTIENAVGGSGNDTIIGNDAGDQLFGGGGMDNLAGGAGNDLIGGGAGADSMGGGAGFNSLYYADSPAAVTINFFAGTGSGGDAQGDSFTNMQGAVGSAFNDAIYGDNNGNYIDGGAGNDTLLGYGGNDTIVGGAGNDLIGGGTGADTLNGNAGFNLLYYKDSVSAVTINFFTGTGSGGDAQGDSFTNMQGVIGSAFNDTIYGDNSGNYIDGSAGNDIIVGFGGNDYLVGGAGSDLFVYTAAGFGHDEVAGFTVGQDHFYVSTSIAANFAALSLSASGANTLVTIGADSIQIDGLTPAQLHASDFIFY